MDYFDTIANTRPPAAGTPERSTRMWLITFTDLVALMLTFFVMMFAMSSVKVAEWRSIIDSLSQSLRPTEEKTPPAATSAFNIGTIFRKRASDLDYLTSVLGEAMAGDPLLSQSRLSRLEDRLIIGLPGDVVFAPGRAEPTEEGRQILFMLGGVLRNIGNRIGVNGHSMDAAQVDGGHASDWELSMARAAAVANALRRSGYTDDIIAFGYGDGRRALLDEFPDDIRDALSRRVDIVVRPEAGDR